MILLKSLVNLALDTLRILTSIVIDSCSLSLDSTLIVFLLNTSQLNIFHFSVLKLFWFLRSFSSSDLLVDDVAYLISGEVMVFFF